MTGMLLITGGAGFIGSHVVEAALGAGMRVRVLDSLRPDVHPVRPDGWTPTAVCGDAEFLVGDVTDPSVAARAVRGTDAVLHLAAKVGLGVDFSDAPDYMHTNASGTAVLLRAMTRAGVSRFVLASSMVVYGAGVSCDERGRLATPHRTAADLAAGRFEPVSPRTGSPVSPALTGEDDGTDPRNVYAASKLAQEHLAAAWARETGGRAALLRYHNVYGPRMPRDTPYAGVAAIFRSSLAAGRAPQVFEDGGQRRDFVHVRDVAAANLAALAWTQDPRASAPPARAFNIGSGSPRTVGDLADALAGALGGPAPQIAGGYRLGDVRHITASVTRARYELDWRAEIDFADGIRELASTRFRRPVPPP
ncbi:NAD-dependent dehydratase [Microbacterium mangrovi]|uniref:NAD-dependent dehydratase n=1 Tax=Microbacterium mangrovi TaxID=1348253 RepID=A0A0B2A9J7_9MICO|nr:NAD-dependent epimerase/dehydratase family protein [Microbacterium mangrovi]KHK98286.1 NAD-dependent dehydratase [Microbacterium mangrovi]